MPYGEWQKILKYSHWITAWCQFYYLFLYDHIYISAVWGVTENTQVFPLEYCIMYNTIFGYLIIMSNKVCPSFCWMLFPSKVCPFSCGIIIMFFILWGATSITYKLLPKYHVTQKERPFYLLLSTGEHDKLEK